MRSRFKRRRGMRRKRRRRRRRGRGMRGRGKRRSSRTRRRRRGQRRRRRRRGRGGWGGVRDPEEGEKRFFHFLILNLDLWTVYLFTKNCYANATISIHSKTQLYFYER